MNKALHGVMQRVHFGHGESYDRKAAVVFRGLYRRVAEDVAAAAPEDGTVLDAADSRWRSPTGARTSACTGSTSSAAWLRWRRDTLSGRA